MGGCHLCENISFIDALILTTRVTFASHTLEPDKYRRETSWLISVSSGMLLLENLLQQRFAFKSNRLPLHLHFRTFKSRVTECPELSIGSSEI